MNCKNERYEDAIDCSLELISFFKRFEETLFPVREKFHLRKAYLNDVLTFNTICNWG